MPPPRNVEWGVRTPQAVEVPTRPDVLVAAQAAREWGVLSLDELQACGLAKTAVAVRVRNGRLHPMFRGVYAVGHANVPLEGRFLAAVKACGPGAVLSSVSAAVHWGLARPRPGPIHVAVSGDAGRAKRGIRAHRTVIEPFERRRHRGVPVTSPARTLLDCAAVLDARSLRRAVREAQALGLVTIEDLVAILRRLEARRGCRKLANIVASGPAPTRSVLEDVVFDLIVRGGLIPPDVNKPLWLDGRKVVPDFRWPEARLVVEADGAAWHDHKLAREDDAERQALLERHGERVIRITWGQAIGRPAETLTRVRAAGAPRRVGTSFA